MGRVEERVAVPGVLNRRFSEVGSRLPPILDLAVNRAHAAISGRVAGSVGGEGLWGCAELAHLADIEQPPAAWVAGAAVAADLVTAEHLVTGGTVAVAIGLDGTEAAGIVELKQGARGDRGADGGIHGEFPP